MVDDTTRLERIEARAKGLGWSCIPSSEHYNSFVLIVKNSFKLSFNKNNAGLTAAEALLSPYEPGPVVEIVDGITLEPSDPGNRFSVKMPPTMKPVNFTPEDLSPAPDGKEWALVLRDKVEDYEQE